MNSNKIDKGPMRGMKMNGGFIAYVFGLIIFLFSQLVQYSPGVDVSPWAFSHTAVQPNSIFGLSIQTFAAVILGAICLAGVARKQTSDVFHARLFVLAALGFVTLSSAVMSDSLVSVIDTVGQVAIPVLSYMYLSSHEMTAKVDTGTTLMILISLFTILQVAASKLLFGSFAVHNYYYEIDPEYFGFFHHPFAFAGVLAVSAILLLFVMATRGIRGYYVILIVACIALIILTQVRTYILAAVVGLAVGLCIVIAQRKRVGTVVALSPLLFAAVTLFWHSVPSMLAADRANTDLSSGRFDRWTMNLATFFDQASLSELLFGGGATRVIDINEQAIGTRISSLNFFVDSLINFGLVGSVLLISVLVLVFVDASSKGSFGLTVSLGSLMIITSLITSPFGFPIVGVALSVALCSLRDHRKESNNANLGAPSAAIS